MDNDLFSYSPIVEREPIHWPGDARVAFYVGLNVEHFRLTAPRRASSRELRRSCPIRSTTAGATTGPG
jgi:allantoinase